MQIGSICIVFRQQYRKIQSKRFYSTAMKILGQHRRQGATFHVVRSLTDRCHFRGFVSQAFHQPDQAAIADERITVKA